jgi:hypothetical protein
MLSIQGLNNIVCGPRSQLGKVKKAYEAVLSNSCSPFDVYFEHLQVLNIEEIVKDIHKDVFTQNEYYVEYPDLHYENPVLIYEFIDRITEVLINAFVQERYDIGENIPEDFAVNFATGIHKAIILDEAYDHCFD